MKLPALKYNWTVYGVPYFQVGVRCWAGRHYMAQGTTDRAWKVDASIMVPWLTFNLSLMGGRDIVAVLDRERSMQDEYPF